MKNSLIAALVLSGSICLPLLIPVAYAQDEEIEIEEVLVTARYREESIQDIGASIKAISTRELDERGVNTISALAALTPSLSNQERGPNRNEISIRGIGRSLFQQDLTISSPNIGVYFDDVPVNVVVGSQMDIRNLDLARVEVVRGPQGTLYGEGAEGGAVITMLDALKLDGCHVLGHHTGAQTATEVALVDRRIKSLIMNTPFILSEDESDEMRNQVLPLEQQIEPRADGGHMVDIWQWRAQFAEGFVPDVMHTHIIEQLRRYRRGWYGHNACFNYDHGKKIKNIQQPTLILTNTGDFLLEYAKRVLDIRPDFKFVEMKGGTLDIIDEQPEAWADAVANFVLKEQQA